MLLGFDETKKLLDKYIIETCKTKLAKTEAEALSFANEIGYPIVLKIDSTDVVHKSDGGFVKVNIKNNQELKNAYNELIEKSKNFKVNGILVQEMVFGTELVIGMKRDEQFGPVIMFGLGGVFVEILKDVILRVAPLTKNDAIEMIKSIKSYKVLQGYRGEEVVNIEKLADIIVKISNLSIENENIKEIDINPVMANENQILAVDARILT